MSGRKRSKGDFEEAVADLKEVDLSKDPNGEERLVADLVLEGGGVKGIGLVGAVLVLSEAGYTFPRVAGTSAGAIAAVLIASIGKAGKPMWSLRGYLEKPRLQTVHADGPCRGLGRGNRRHRRARR